MDTTLENISDQAQNEAIQKWGSKVRLRLRANARQFTRGKKDGFVMTKDDVKEGRLSESIYTKFGKSFGAITAVSFGFERHGVFVQKGVGRGHGINKVMVLKNADDARVVVSGRTREPRDWFNSEIEKNLPDLADKLAEINADLVLDSTKIMIK